MEQSRIFFSIQVRHWNISLFNVESADWGDLKWNANPKTMTLQIIDY